MSKSKLGSGTSSATTTASKFRMVSEKMEDASYFTRPEFIYGGPFIGVKIPSPFIDSTTPMNIPLQGTFTRSFAYFSLKDRLPVILTKIIDDFSKKGTADSKQFLEIVTKLKNDLVTNKEYAPFTVDTPEAMKWNQWLTNQQDQKYFNNVWMFTECYIYRRLYEGCELIPGLKNYDYFSDQKQQSFQGNLRPMCLVSDKVVTMLSSTEKEKRKADLITLLKLTLWANKCDLSLSLGEQVTFGATPEPAATPEPPPAPAAAPAGKGKSAEPPKPTVPSSDPFQMILDLKDKLLVDDTGKIADQVVAKAENIQKAIAGNTIFKYKCSCHRLAKVAGTQTCQQDEPEPEPLEEGEEPEELPKIPCPAKMTIPNHVMFDIVCDNAGYELFADLCLASFLIETKIVEMVRFHVKKMPWFVSDVTLEDFKLTKKSVIFVYPIIEKAISVTTERYVIEAASKAKFSAVITLPPGPEGEVDYQEITANNLNELGEKWQTLLADGKFVLMNEDYWTYPHGYCEMKKYDYNLYRKLQYAAAVLFKGDLNYRKLLADRCVNPYSGLEPGLQGFIPAPIIAIRTVKSELICGMPKGRYEVLNKLDPNWMRTGEYGVIQFLAKAEPLKPSDKPCIDYCETCFGVICPEHTHDM